MGFFGKKKSHKIFWIFVFILIGIILLEFGLRFYDKWKGQRNIEELARALEEWERGLEQAKIDDKIGGASPQETLTMFIEAVEEGNYELASKYFVVGKQEEELKSLQNSPKENIDNVMNLLRLTKNDNGEYSEDKNSFSVYNPILINFVLYPSGNWKIEEI